MNLFYLISATIATKMPHNITIVEIWGYKCLIYIKTTFIWDIFYNPAYIASQTVQITFYMMTSSNGNIFRVTGHLCGEFTGPRPGTGEFPTQRPVTRSFDVFFYLRPNKWLSKQWWGWWFETISCSLWRHHNEDTSQWFFKLNCKSRLICKFNENMSL